MMKPDRTITWCQEKILFVLTQKKEVKTYLALSELVLEKVRSVQESRNLNIAITNLIVFGQIQRSKDKNGIIVYRQFVKTTPKGGSQ